MKVRSRFPRLARSHASHAYRVHKQHPSKPTTRPRLHRRPRLLLLLRTLILLFLTHNQITSTSSSLSSSSTSSSSSIRSFSLLFASVRFAPLRFDSSFPSSRPRRRCRSSFSLRFSARTIYRRRHLFGPVVFREHLRRRNSNALSRKSSTPPLCPPHLLDIPITTIECLYGLHQPARNKLGSFY